MAGQIKSDDTDLVLNAGGSGSDIKFQSNGTEVASISDGGVVTATTFTGAATDSTKLPLSGGTMTGTIAGFTSTGIDDNADATAITIDSNEKVMIGTTTEGVAGADQLTVAGSGNTGITIRAGTSSGSAIYMSDATSGSGEYAGYISYSHSANAMAFASNSSERMRIDSSGRVGIGTSSPALDLEVQSNSGSATQIAISNTGTGEAGLYFDASNGDFSGSDYAWISQNNDLSLEITTASLSNAPIILKTNDTERLRIDSSGNVGIGVVPENNALGSSLQIGSGGQIIGDTSETVYLGTNFYYNSGFKRIAAKHVAMQSFTDNGKHIFYTAGTDSADSAISLTTAMTIDNSGNVLVGTTSADPGGSSSNGRVVINTQNNGYAALTCFNTGTSAVNIISLENGNGDVGRIQVNGSSTSYLTTSDYRIKENVDYTWDATTRIKQLKPARFNFIADDTNTLVDGFIAHEVSSIVPEAVSGEKDAMKDEEYEVTPAVKDEDGNIVTEAVMGTRSVIDAQGIDQSKLVPLLVKTIQELEARISALES